MKKSLLLILGIVTSTCCMGQTNTFPTNGNIGIGTLSPQFKLHILGGHHNTNLSLQFDHQDPTKQANLTLWASEPGWTYTGTGIGNNVFNGPNAITRINSLKGGSYIRLLDQELRFNVVGTDGSDINTMYIHQSGNISIGSFNASRRLSVNHESGYGQVVRFSSKLEDHQVGIGTEDTGFSWVGSTTNHNFQIYANNSAKMTVMSNGNVGVGTITPNAKLAVNGNIRAKEIKVENANWPDFVFAKGYSLPTLKETETHIKEKGHLPGIPSAVEVKANGVDLGEMNAKLLQKIEELTLYIIDLERRVKTVENKN